MPRELVQTVWLGMGIAHPEDWEPAQLGREATHGRCVLVDRTHQRLDVQWRASKAEPDVRRMFSHYRRSVKAADSEDWVGPAGWEGFLERSAKQMVTRAGKYFPQEHRLVELALVWPGSRDKALERQILSGIAPQPAGRADQLWQALGLSLAVPAELELDRYQALPGHIRLEFKGRAGRLGVSRLGLVDQWLTKPLADWLAEEQADWRSESAETKLINGHQGFSRCASRLVAGPGRLIGRRAFVNETVWVCPRTGRLYRVSWNSSGRQDKPQPSWAIGCCQPLV